MRIFQKKKSFTKLRKRLSDLENWVLLTASHCITIVLRLVYYPKLCLSSLFSTVSGLNFISIFFYDAQWFCLNLNGFSADKRVKNIDFCALAAVFHAVVVVLLFIVHHLYRTNNVVFNLMFAFCCSFASNAQNSILLCQWIDAIKCRKLCLKRFLLLWKSF